MPWAPTKDNPYGDPEGYIMRGQSVHISWERCNDYPEYLTVKEIARRTLEENPVVFDRLAQL